MAVIVAALVATRRARSRSDAGGGGHVVALGPTDGLLRAIEDAWHLPRLGLSRKATPIGGIWKG